MTKNVGRDIRPVDDTDVVSTAEHDADKRVAGNEAASVARSLEISSPSLGMLVEQACDVARRLGPYEIARGVANQRTVLRRGQQGAVRAGAIGFYIHR